MGKIEETLDHLLAPLECLRAEEDLLTVQAPRALAEKDGRGSSYTLADKYNLKDKLPRTTQGAACLRSLSSAARRS